MSIALPASLTLTQATAALAELQSALGRQAAGDVELDASGLQQLDTSAIAVLLQCRRELQARGASLRLIGAPEQLQQLMRLYGVAELFGIPVAAPAPSSAASPAQAA